MRLAPVAHVARLYRAVVTRGSIAVVGAWAAAAIVVPMVLTSTSGQGTGTQGLLPADSHAVQVEKLSLRQFAVPLLSETSVVLYNPRGLPVLTRADAIMWALSRTQAASRAAVPPGPGHIIAGLPIPVARDDVAVTYLYTSSGTSAAVAYRLAQQYAAHFRNSHVAVYVTGLVPAQVRQQHYLTARLDVFAVASVLLVVLIVAVTFRSVVAPVLVLLIAGVGYLITEPLLALLSRALGFALPQQIEPVVVALLLGVVTDYSVLFFSQLRRQVAAGLDHGAAVRPTLVHNAGVVAIAGVTVAGGTSALLVANLQLFRAFGPALAITVAMGLLISLTLTPALMTILGRRVFRLRSRSVVRHVSREPSSLRARTTAWLTRPGGAIITLVCGVVVLLVAAAPVLGMRLDVSFTAPLPRSDDVQRGAAALAKASVRGVTAPTELLIEAPGIAQRRAQLDRLQREVSDLPGVADVLGPAQNPLPRRFEVALSRDGNAARLAVIFDSDPLGSIAITDLRNLQARLPALATQAGLTKARLEVTGQTAIAAELAALTRVNLRLTVLVALCIEFVILAVYLRALITPLVLLAYSALVVAAALGLTTLLFQEGRGDAGLTFYAPFATAVLLFSLGSDYNVFSVGTIWDEAHRHPLREAIRRAVPQSSRAVTAAGFILAATLATVAIIPLETFREVAFTMAVGLLLDTLIARPLLTPAVLTLLGPVARWPGHRHRAPRG